MSLSQKIILAEDDNDLREMYRMKLERKGYKILSASDGLSALNLIKNKNPDLILLDILLPKKDGFEILRSVRNSKNDKIKSIPVIIISNLSNKEDRNEAEKIGISSYLIKSDTTLETLIKTIKITLDTTKQQQVR